MSYKGQFKASSMVLLLGSALFYNINAHAFLNDIDLDQEVESVPAIENPDKAPHYGKIFQASTHKALALGQYNGNTTLKTVMGKGDFAIGVFNGLEGELIGLEGQFFRCHPGGALSHAELSDMTPFSVVTSFHGKPFMDVGKVKDLKALNRLLDRKLSHKKMPYAIRVTGQFSQLNLRCLVRQSVPFKPLLDAIKQSSTYQLEAVSGTLVGYWFPDDFSGINQPGYHFNFMTSDHSKGGHVLNMAIQTAEVSVYPIDQVEVILPHPESDLELAAASQ